MNQISLVPSYNIFKFCSNFEKTFDRKQFLVENHTFWRISPLSRNEIQKYFRDAYQGPHLRTPNPGLNPGLTPRICYIKGRETRVKPGVWRPEIWA
jgi:hypothetical protein